MHRALEGAPTLSGHQSALLGQGLLRRSLGRSLRGNAMRVRRSWCCGRVGAAATPASSPDTLLQAKNKRGSSSSRLLRSKSPYGAGCCASPDKHFKAKAWGGRGAGTPAPQLRLALKEQKTDISRTDFSMKRISLVIKYLCFDRIRM